MKTLHFDKISNVIKLNGTELLQNGAEVINLAVTNDSELILTNLESNEININVSKNVTLKIDSLSFLDSDKKINIDLSENSNVSLNFITNYKTKLNLNVNLNGEYANFDAKILSLASNFESSFDSQITHNAKYTSSNIKNYGVSLEDSQILFNTTGKILKGMAKSNCYQLTRGIIAGEKGAVKALPILLIDEYDVSANHGAAIGKMSDDELFYLMSRGLTKQESFKLILSGILKPFVDNLIDDNMKDYVQNEIYKLI